MVLASFPKVILPAILGACACSYIFGTIVTGRGGAVPHTVQDKEWEKETHRKLDAWPREAAGPVVMNPISRQNYRKL